MQHVLTKDQSFVLAKLERPPNDMPNHICSKVDADSSQKPEFSKIIGRKKWNHPVEKNNIYPMLVANLRQQDYQGYSLWLLDFWNGFGEYPIDPLGKEY